MLADYGRQAYSGKFKIKKFNLFNILAVSGYNGEDDLSLEYQAALLPSLKFEFKVDCRIKILFFE